MKIVSTNISTSKSPVMASTNPGQIAFWNRFDDLRLSAIDQPLPLIAFVRLAISPRRSPTLS